MHDLTATLLSHHRRLGAVGLCLFVCFVLSTSFALAMNRLDEGVEPLPQGCIHGTPPGEEPPLCCLSGFVYIEGQPVKNAEITIFDAQGEIGKAYTKEYRGLEAKPYYYIDLTKLKIRTINATRSITPSDVITLMASYNGITAPRVAYTVQKGGQRFDFNPYDQNVLALSGENTGVAEIGKFQSISGATMDSQGNLYLWDAGNYRMLVLRPDGSGTWLDRPNWQREPGSLPNQVINVSGIAIDRKNAHVYLAEPYRRLIEVYTSYGDTLPPITTPDNVWSIGVDNAANLYALTLFDGIYKYGPDGSVLKHLPDEELVNIIGKQTVGNDTSRKIAVSPQGEIFVAREVPNGVFKFSNDLTPLSYSLQLTSGLPISKPYAIMVDDANTLFVFDHASFKLYAFDATGMQLARSWPSPPFSAGSAIYLTHFGDFVYLISQYDGMILQLPKQGGSPLRTWGGQVNNHGSVEVPADITVAQDGSLWVADYWTGRISRMVNNKIEQSWNSTRLGHWSSAESDQLPVQKPIALAFDHASKLLLATSTYQIQRLRYENSTLMTDTLPWGGFGDELGKFSSSSAVPTSPAGLATDKNGFVFVTDPGNHRIQVLQQVPSATGFVAITSITVTGVLSQPLGIAVDDRNNPTMIYVVDRAYSHIVKLSFDGTQLNFMDTIGSYGFDKGHFVFPTHIDMAVDGSLWVADNNYRVHRIDPNDLNNWHIYGNPSDPSWHAYGIAITKTDDYKDLLYVSSWAYGHISSFTPMTESDPLATIVHCSDGDLLPGEILTCVAAGQDGDATNTIVRYEWSTESSDNQNGLYLITDRPAINIQTVASATQIVQLGSGLHTLRLRVQDNEEAWSSYVNTSIYVAPALPAPRPPDISTPDPVQPPPVPPVTCLAGSMWTMLLYLDADNKNDGVQLLEDYHESLNELKKLNHACVRVAVQIDGLPVTDVAISRTERWLIRFGSDGAHVDGPLPIDEQQMDDPQTLSDFITWGQQQANWGEGASPTNYYYLAIADHGNAFQGIAFDHTTDPTGNAYLTANDLRIALETPGVQPIDILHLDACSMALLDVAYEVRDKVDYLIASQYIGWSFFAYADYASYITQWTQPDELAKLIVNRYATLAEARQLPYTLSALNLARVGPLKSAIDNLAMFLKAWVGSDGAARMRRTWLFDKIRNDKKLRNETTVYDALFFDSNSNYINTPRDAYIDLKDFVTRLQHATPAGDSKVDITADIIAAATLVLQELEHPMPATDKLILHERHSSIAYLPAAYGGGAAIAMQNAGGISLYYPVEGVELLALPQEPSLQDVAAAATVGASTELTYTQVYADYIHNQLFDFTSAARWSEFLVAAYGEIPRGVQLLAPTAPLTVPVPVNNTQVTLQQHYSLEDKDHNGPSAGDILHFTTQINNQSDVTLTHVVLVQLFDQPVEQAVSVVQYPCTANNPQQVCIPVADIAAKGNAAVPFTVILSTNTPPVSQAMLYVNDQPLGEPVTPTSQQNLLYLPVVMK